MTPASYLTKLYGKGSYKYPKHCYFRNERMNGKAITKVYEEALDFYARHERMKNGKYSNLVMIEEQDLTLFALYRAIERHDVKAVKALAPFNIRKTQRWILTEAILTTCTIERVGLLRWIVGNLKTSLRERQMIFYELCGNGHLELAKEMYEMFDKSPVISEMTMKACTYRNQLEVLKWLYTQGEFSEAFMADLCKTATMLKRDTIVEWINSKLSA